MKTYEDDIYTPSMVAELFKVHPRSVTRWANQGKLRSFRTPGGHRRFRKEDVEAFMKTVEVE